MAGALAAVGGLFLDELPGRGRDRRRRAARAGGDPGRVLGGLDSPGGAVVGGLIIGVVSVLTAGYQDELSFLGPRAGRRRALRGDAARAAVAAVRAVRDAGGDPCLGAPPSSRSSPWSCSLALPLYLESFWLQTGLFAMAAIIAAIGLTILVGTAGQLSLAHAFFVAIGAYGYCFLAGAGRRRASTRPRASGCRRCWR